MVSVDAFLVRLSIVLCLTALLFRRSIAWELLDGVWDVQATIHCTLQGTPDSASVTSAPQADIKNALERTLVVLFLFNVVLFRIKLLLSLDSICQADCCKAPPGDEQARAICSCVVLVAGRNAIVLEFIRTGCCYALVSHDGGIDNLADDALVAEAYDQSVLLGFVLCLVLLCHPSACGVVSLALTTAALLHLEPLEEGSVLHQFHERHGRLGPT
mmetsp:Transcript_39503/g.88415  ORF Transcript_39503/g.88415 Transcript_39503/m.88415 type:complete len:215 (-) Transcript_39503:71-715(-)